MNRLRILIALLLLCAIVAGEATVFAQVESTALYAVVYVVFEDGSCRSRTVMFVDGAIVCGGQWTYYCPLGPGAPCMALDIPDTSGIPFCGPYYARGSRVDGGGQ